ncbi:MAG: PEP-CTERM sorting domain-containing protein [Planctomycetota bacterium]
MLDLSNLDGTNGFIVNGIEPNDNSGYAASSAGDINHDGIGDFIIGATSASPNGISLAGQAYIVFGGADVGATGIFELDSIDGSNGFTLNGSTPTGSTGFSVSNAGDLNHDGIDDTIIGTIFGNGATGQSHVVFGSTDPVPGGVLDLGSLDGSNGFTLNGISFADLAGVSTSYAGDINDDGVDDVIIGASGSAVLGSTTAGESYVVFGRENIGSSGTLDLASLDGSDGFTITGIDVEDQVGQSVSTAGDVNGDGVDDLIIGAGQADPNGNDSAGESYVVFGGEDVGAGGTLRLTSLDGFNGFVINGVATQDNSGTSVSAAGDVNDDGFADLIIGAANGNGGTGQAHVVFGTLSLGSSGTLDLDTLDGSDGFVINGLDTSNQLGFSVSTGDVNGDGISDLIIGDPLGGPAGNVGSGESYVIFGVDNLGRGGEFDLNSLDGANGFVLEGVDFDDRSGWSVSGTSDINDDGIGDLIISAPFAAPNGDDAAGESYVVFGLPYNTWDITTGGDFDRDENWFDGSAPSDFSGVMLIEPQFGGTIEGPDDVVIVDRFTLGSELGVVTFDLPTNGVIQVRHDMELPSSAVLTGDGSFVVDGVLDNNGEIDLGDDGLYISATLINNTGLLRGSGRIDAPVINIGSIEAFDLLDEIRFDESVTNATGGQIVGRGMTARFNAGLMNQGELNISFGISDIFGDITNTGSIGLAGGAQLTLFDDLIQNGTLDIRSGSTAVVFGDFSGAGGTDGTGTLEVLGTFSPGNSPDVIAFGGDLDLSSSIATLIELGGLALGEFDRNEVAALLTLGGDLNVELYGGHTLGLNQTYEIFTANLLSGTFSNFNDGDLVGVFNGVDLFIDYDFNQGSVSLFTVPEPATATLLTLGISGLMRRRCRAKPF